MGKKKKQRPHCPRTPSLPPPVPNYTIPPSRRRDPANGESATTTNPPPPPSGSSDESTAPPGSSQRRVGDHHQPTSPAVGIQRRIHRPAVGIQPPIHLPVAAILPPIHLPAAGILPLHNRDQPNLPSPGSCRRATATNSPPASPEFAPQRPSSSAAATFHLCHCGLLPTRASPDRRRDARSPTGDPPLSSLSSLHRRPESYPRHPALPPCSSRSTSRIRRSCTELCHRAPH
ncbi:hypothetical protein ACQJBY_066774 [Aegilops geniculata]